MADSNGGWGDLAEHDDDMAQAWDAFTPLPEPGEHDALDAFLASKHIDTAAMLRLGARMAGTLVIAFSFAHGIKYRQLESGKRWAYPGSEFKRLKVVPASGEPADTVIVAEGETDAARLLRFYPACDVAVIPAGAKRWTAAFAEQLAPYRRVVVALDADQAGEQGWAKIQETLPRAVRLVPPENPDNDWCGLPADAQPPELPEPGEAEDLTVGKIQFRRLGELVRQGIPEPEVLVDDLLYTEGVHLVSGHPGCGKTTIVMHMAVMAMAASRRVLWLDYEAGITGTARRIQNVGANPDVLDECFLYADWPDKAERRLAAMAEKWPGAVVVIDSLSKALSFAGINENDASEVTSWTTRVVKACKDHRLPIIIIDHIAKSGALSEYSRGSGAKLADVDVHWRVVKTEPFNRERPGVLTIHQMKDREGALPFETWWRVGNGEGSLVVEPLDAPPGQTDTEDEPVL